MFHAIRRFWAAVCRALAYAKFGWGNHDWDHAYFYSFLRFKLERMQKQFAIDETTSDARTKSVRVAVRLAKRLEQDNYRHGADAHDKKWGELEMKLGAIDKMNCRQVFFKRKKATARTAKKEQIEFMAAVNADHRAQVRDIKYLTLIINKYVQHWWS